MAVTITMATVMVTAAMTTTAAEIAAVAGEITYILDIPHAPRVMDCWTF